MLIDDNKGRRYRRNSPKENKIYKTLVYSSKHKKYLSIDQKLETSLCKEKDNLNYKDHITTSSKNETSLKSKNF